MQHKIFCFRDYIKTESPTAVQRAFRLRFNIQLPTTKSICRWNHKFEQIGCLLFNWVHLFESPCIISRKYIIAVQLYIFYWLLNTTGRSHLKNTFTSSHSFVGCKYQESACCIRNRTELGASTSQSWVPLQRKAPAYLWVKPVTCYHFF